MSLRPTIEVPGLDETLREQFGGRRCVVVGGSVAALVDVAEELASAGAARCLLVGSSTGTGPAPDPAFADWCSLDLSGADPEAVAKAYESALADTPPRLRRRVEAFDPEGAALALGFSVPGDLPAVAGRRVLGPRRPAWIALEDKCRIDRLWHATGVPSAPTHVTPVAAAREAALRVDEGSGTVWAADSSQGPHAGGRKTRWVRTPEQAEEAERFFDSRCRTVRVMPFLEGVPCSVHALITRGGEAVFRPVELLTLVRPDDGTFLFCGVSTYWDPPPDVRTEMRSCARRVARHLWETIGFTGAFSLDGIFTARGFLPTELNPRPSIGLRLLTLTRPELPLGLLALAAQESGAASVDVRRLEQVVLDQSDSRRDAVVGIDTNQTITRPGGIDLVPDPAPATPDADPEERGPRGAPSDEYLPVTGRIEWGPSEVGGYIGYAPGRHDARVGLSLARPLVRALETAERELGLAPGRVEPPHGRPTSSMHDSSG